MNAIKRKSMYLVFVVAMALSLLFAGKVQLNAATMAPTGVIQTDASSSGVQVSWNAVMQDNINYYYRISNDTTFAACKTGMVYSNTCVNIFNLNSGAAYYMQIGTSTTRSSTLPDDIVWSDAIEVTTAPNNVDGSSIKLTDASTTSMTLAWDVPTGANYYNIKYWIAGANEDTASTVSSNTNSVNITGLQKNTQYHVKVYPYRVSAAGYQAGYGYGYGYKPYLSVLPSKITDVENTKFYTNINVAYFGWDNSASADGYQYYIYNNSNKKILSGTISSNSLRVDSSKIKKNQFYRIKVRGYVELANNKVKYGSWSNLTYFAEAPHQKVSLKQSGKNIKASWNKVAGATNYTVYISNKPNSGFKKVGTVTKTSTTIKKYGKSSLKSGKTYYVRVVANKKVKVGGKNKTFKSTLYFNYAKYIKMK